MSSPKTANPFDPAFHLAAGVLSTLAVVYITSRQHLALERWLPSMHLFAAAAGAYVSSIGQMGWDRWDRWDVAAGVLVGTQHTFELWSFLKLPSTTAIALSLIAVPLNLLLPFFFLPSPTPAARLTTALLFLLLGLALTTAGKQDPLCTTLALLAIASRTALNFLTGLSSPHSPRAQATSLPTSIACLATALLTAVCLALTMGGRVTGYKVYIPSPFHLGIASAALFGWAASFQLAKANTNIDEGSKMNPINGKTVRPVVVAAGAVVVTLLCGKRVDVSGSVRGSAWVQALLLLGAAGAVLYMAPWGVLFQAEEGEEESYDLTPAGENALSTNPTPPSPLLYSWGKKTSRLTSIAYVLCLAPLVVFLAQQSSLIPYHPTFDTLSSLAPLSQLGISPAPLPGSVAKVKSTTETTSALAAPRPQLEVVFAYYNEPLAGVRAIVADVKREVGWWDVTSTAYHKGLSAANANANTHASPQANEREILEQFVQETGVDTVVPLENIGREGATYLRHILHRWDDLAYLTVFLQGHVAFDYTFWERLKLVNERIGFMSLGHYLTVTNGTDSWDNGYFPRIADIYELFREKPYPSDETLLTTYHGQFVVSRERIRKHPKYKYEQLLHILEAPMDDPIHNEGYGYKDTPEGPANPFFGHSLERAWTLIFRCDSKYIERDCSVPHPVSYRCYCADF